MTKSALSVAFVAGAVLATAASAQSAEEPMELTFHTIMVAEDPIAQCARTVLAPEIESRSGGAMTVTVYDSAQLFPQGSNSDALAQGQIDLEVTAVSTHEDMIPYASMFTSAYIFESVDHAQRFWSSPEGQRVMDDVAEATNIRPLSGMMFYGTRQLSLTDAVDREVRTPEDLEGVKLRMANFPSWIALGRALGADPTPVAFNETYLALQSGVVDGQDNGLTVSRAMGFHEQTSQLVLTDHLIWNLHFAINEDRWQSLSDEQKGWVQGAADEAHACVTDRILQGEEELIETYRSEGVTIVEPDKDAFIEHARAFYETDPLAQRWDRELYDRVVEMADE